MTVASNQQNQHKAIPEKKHKPVHKTEKKKIFESYSNTVATFLEDKMNSPYVKLFLVIVCILLVLISFYHVLYAKKIIPGVHAGGVDLGGMTFIEAKSALQQKEQEVMAKNLVLEYEGQQFDFGSSLFDLQYNADATAARAFEVGRTGNPVVDTREKLVGLIKPLEFKVYYSMEDSELNSIFATVKGELNKNAQNAYYKITDAKLEIVPETSGIKVDSDELYRIVIASLDTMDFTHKKVPIEQDEPNVTSANLQEHIEEVANLVFSPLSVIYKEDTWVLGPEQKLELLAVEADEFGVVDLALDDSAFGAFVETLEQEVNMLPRGRVVETHDDQVVDFEITQSGQELNVNTFEREFGKALLTGTPATVELSVQETNDLADPLKYGIFALLGEGTSKYTGSAEARIHNLSLAAERANGVLVPPGSVFSFNESVGDISKETGYATAYVISRGRTVLGDGGGVCQTSTTLFRAVLDAGLPVISRHPHAYRVYYYEIDSDVGFDASIYQPSLDFQFKNDTTNYVLVQSFQDKKNQLLGFKLYGTPDGREVEISKATVTNVSPPPEPLYQDDPELPKGQTKQVDFAAWGATASFNRVVKDKFGEVMYTDTFTTNYQPWQAVYLVGTKE